MKRAFNHELDEKIWSKQVAVSNVVVSVHRYAGGVPKVQITRSNFKREAWVMPSRKLGRMTRAELEALIPVLQEALGYLV